MNKRIHLYITAVLMAAVVVFNSVMVLGEWRSNIKGNTVTFINNQGDSTIVISNVMDDETSKSLISTALTHDHYLYFNETTNNPGQGFAAWVNDEGVRIGNDQPLLLYTSNPARIEITDGSFVAWSFQWFEDKELIALESYRFTVGNRENKGSLPTKKEQRPHVQDRAERDKLFEQYNSDITAKARGVIDINKPATQLNGYQAGTVFTITKPGIYLCTFEGLQTHLQGSFILYVDDSNTATVTAPATTPEPTLETTPAPVVVPTSIGDEIKEVPLDIGTINGDIWTYILDYDTIKNAVTMNFTNTPSKFVGYYNGEIDFWYYTFPQGTTVNYKINTNIMNEYFDVEIDVDNKIVYDGVDALETEGTVVFNEPGFNYIGISGFPISQKGNTTRAGHVRGFEFRIVPFTETHTPTTPAPTPPAADGKTQLVLTIGSLTYTLNGASKTLAVAPELMNGSTMVPLRFITEAFGAEVAWDGGTETAIIKLDGKEVKVTVGKMEAGMNTPAVNKNGSVLVPLRFVGEAFGCELDYDGSTQKITITR